MLVMGAVRVGVGMMVMSKMTVMVTVMMLKMARRREEEEGGSRRPLAGTISLPSATPERRRRCTYSVLFYCFYFLSFLI
jgi:hypothetical protein